MNAKPSPIVAGSYQANVGNPNAPIQPLVGDQLTTLISILAQLQSLIQAGFSNPQIDIITVASATSATLFPAAKPVKRYVIQNLSTLDNLTLVAASTSQAKTANVTAGVGILLNKAPASGQGGGTLSGNNVDLSGFSYIISDTGSKISVYYET